MEKIVKVQKEHNILHIICDKCGDETYDFNHKCVRCKQDICLKDTYHSERVDYDNTGQYWCKECWIIELTYQPEIEEHFSRVRVLIEELIQECKRKSMEKKPVERLH